MLQRFRFRDLFELDGSGVLRPKKTIGVNGVTISPGISLGHGVLINGVDFYRYQMYDVAVEMQNEVHNIKGFYSS